MYLLLVYICSFSANLSGWSWGLCSYTICTSCMHLWFTFQWKLALEISMYTTNCRKKTCLNTLSLSYCLHTFCQLARLYLAHYNCFWMPRKISNRSHKPCWGTWLASRKVTAAITTLNPKDRQAKISWKRDILMIGNVCFLIQSWSRYWNQLWTCCHNHWQ